MWGPIPSIPVMPAKATTMKRLGSVGILTNGCLRDIQQIRTLGGIQLFCAGLVVSHGNPICVSVGDEVTISGLKIRTGDLLHGDATGVVLIPESCVGDRIPAAPGVSGPGGQDVALHQPSRIHAATDPGAHSLRRAQYGYRSLI
jgi:Aldolase/RraA